ncbi:hypothetical protein [Natrarchaeobaculum sulfurireducens]|uniref:Uncharacterized protein n=1 Tax=Natrarchaeobaculum sulfurireducens TaxID=2044521 RepID=A0A346PPP2_9EURY|nr:hypothetical protein [Natrarchaeobaculum sulfurireducens]AXR81487.1 hypothetical protein AArcMg_1474 [Natrarchaeobaculum sulfurireducens]
MTDRLVTNGGKRALRQFLIQNLDEMSVGTGSSDPRSTDDELDVEVHRDDVSNDSADVGRMRSRMKLGVAEANGEQLSELMLHADDDSFARIVFADTEKTEEIELAFEVEIEVQNT